MSAKVAKCRAEMWGIGVRPWRRVSAAEASSSAVGRPGRAVRNSGAPGASNLATPAISGDFGRVASCEHPAMKRWILATPTAASWGVIMRSIPSTRDDKGFVEKTKAAKRRFRHACGTTKLADFGKQKIRLHALCVLARRIIRRDTPTALAYQADSCPLCAWAGSGIYLVKHEPIWLLALTGGRAAPDLRIGGIDRRVLSCGVYKR